VLFGRYFGCAQEVLHSPLLTFSKFLENQIIQTLNLYNLSDELDSRGKQSDSVKNSIIHILVIRQKA